MTPARPAPPSIPRRGRWGLLAGVAIVAAVVAYFAFSGIGDALVYYRTPTEILAMGDGARRETIRLGGLVAADSLSCAGGDVRFTVTDGTQRIPVRAAPGATIQCPRSDAGAVVEGTLGADGVFLATQVLIKHNETYVAPTRGAVPSHVSSALDTT
jgi:cytochrome c-type biogenesis protein CcmE